MLQSTYMEENNRLSGQKTTGQDGVLAGSGAPGPSGHEGSPTTTPSATQGAGVDMGIGTGVSADTGVGVGSEILPGATTPEGVSNTNGVSSSYSGGMGVSGGEASGVGAAVPGVPQSAQPSTQPVQSAPQGIFSRGELTVNSENLETIKPALSEENKSRIASAFAQTDATQQRDQLSDQMASQGQGIISSAAAPTDTSIASTATGDINLPGTKKKSKVPLLIIAALVVLAAVAGVWWVMHASKVSKADVKTAFDAYYNTLISGSDGDSCTPPDGLDTLEFLGTFSCSAESRLAIVTDMKTSYQNFKSQFDASTLADDEELRLLIDYQGKYLQVVAQYLDSSERLAKIIQLYNVGEPVITLEMLGQVQTDELNFDDTLKKFAEAINRETSYTLTEYGFYNENRCLLAGELDNECASIVASGVDELDALYDNQDENSEELDRLFAQVSKQMIANCNTMKGLLYE